MIQTALLCLEAVAVLEDDVPTFIFHLACHQLDVGEQDLLFENTSLEVAASLTWRINGRAGGAE